jgi:CSLREA domain-containing protein
MRASRLFSYPMFSRVSITLLFTLTCMQLAQNAALGQRRISSSEPSQQSHSLHIQFSGEQPRPLAMVSGDFDEDGVDDLVIGYGSQKGGSIAWLRGNLDAIAPQTHASWLAAGRHEYSDAFLQPSKMVSLKTQPSLMVSADVNGDGHLDVVYGSQGSSVLYVMLGTGHGTFLPQPASVTLPGTITALAAYRPGAPTLGEAVIVGYESSRGASLGILNYGATGLSMSATYSLPSAATMLTVANLDADFIPDTAIVAGGELLMLHGKNALSGGGRLETLPISGVKTIAAGEFLFDRHAQLQLSVLTSSGKLVILAHQGLDARPYTPQEIAVARRQKLSHPGSPSLAQQAGNTGNEPWIEAESHAEAGTLAFGSDVPVLLRSRLSGSGMDDLVVLNSSQQQRMVVSHNAPVSELARPPQSRVVVNNVASGSVVAAKSLRVSSDGRMGLVVLHANDASPEIVLPSAGNTFYVNTTADNTGTTTDTSDGTRCTQGSGEVCTLRDAITFVNNDAADNISAGKSDTIMIPAGTYPLTWQAGTLDANGNALTHLELLGPVTIIGSTSGGGVVINADNNDTVFTINPGPFGSFNPSGNSYVFDVTLENLLMENGKNINNANTSATGLANPVGGGINWDAFGTGNLTLNNSSVEKCTILWGTGGGIWAENSTGGGTGTLTLTGGSISNNSTPEAGGAVYIAFPAVALSATNTVFNANRAQVSVNSSDPGADGTAGGLFLTERSTGEPQTTLTGVTVSSNVADVDGGGFFTNTGIVLGTSVVSGNTAGRWGGGMLSEIVSPEAATTITSTNFLSNSATTAGGAILVGPESAANGNLLQISLSRIFGNTSTEGASGLAVGDPGGADAGGVTATENWWGCNAGPATAADGCDQAVLYSADGSLTTAPYAQLGFSSDITSIPAGGSMNLTVALNKDSNGNPITGAFPAVATNYPYTYSVTGVTANPALTTGTFNTSGVGTAVLTPSDSGNGTVTVTFDKQTDTINFTAQAQTGTSLQIAVVPSTAFLYGQPPTSITVQLNPSAATGITTGDFQVLVDGSASLGSSPFGLTLVGANLYAVSGPFNLLSPGSHTLRVNFLGTTTYTPTNSSVGLTVALGTVNISNAITPPNPIQGQGGTVNVTVTAVGSGAGPTGSLNYAFDGGAVTSVGLVAGAAAIPVPTTLSSGGHSLALSYGGDTNYSSTSTTAALTIFGRSQTVIASLTATTATIDVFGLGFTAPSGQLSFTDTTSGSPVAAPVTLNTATASPALLPQVTTSTGVNSLPDWTTLADINGDGKPDLVTSVFGTDSVSVQLGNGDGTFQAATSVLIAAAFGPAENHLVSLRGNGTLDLIVASFNTNQIAVLLGNGNGTFQPPTFYTVGSAANTPTSLTTGDFNHDGDLDVAVANTGDNTISILLGNGSGSLTPLGAPIGVGHDPEAIRAGDFNGDGYSDLAVANYNDGTVTTLLNNENGTFTATTISVGSGAGSGPQALAVNGSGSNLLLAVANFKDNTVSVLQSNGSGAFGTQKIVSVGKGPDDVGFADFNGDGILDLVVSNYTDNTVSLVLGSSGGTYTALAPFNVGDSPYSAAVGDLDLDGTPDIVVSNCFSNNTGVLLSGTRISVPYSGLGLVPGDSLHATYTPDGSSKYGASTSANVTAP